MENINDKGFGLISKAVMQDKNLHITAKAIYAYLCSFAGNKLVVFPSRTKICEDLGIAIDTFNKYLKQLRVYGYIDVVQKRNEGNFSHNEYILYGQPKIGIVLFIAYILISEEIYDYFIKNILNYDCIDFELLFNNAPYTKFLESAYWKCISRYLKENQTKCIKCKNDTKLHIHHKTYKNHFREHLLYVMKNDLAVLCETCHKVEHSAEE